MDRAEAEAGEPVGESLAPEAAEWLAATEGAFAESLPTLFPDWFSAAKWWTEDGLMLAELGLLDRYERGKVAALTQDRATVDTYARYLGEFWRRDLGQGAWDWVEFRAKEFGPALVFPFASAPQDLRSWVTTAVTRRGAREWRDQLGRLRERRDTWAADEHNDGGAGTGGNRE